jgi:hypothetical protein
MARELVTIHEPYIWRFLRDASPGARTTPPDFVPKAAAIVGLAMSPPDNAVVLSADEKPSIQALERAQGYRKPPNRAGHDGQSHDYKRHGTTTLFAALNVARPSDGQTLQAPPPGGVSRLHEPVGEAVRSQRDPRDPGQSVDA